MTNWIKIYEGIDPYEPQKYGVRIAPEDSDQRQEAREEDTQRLTIEFLKAFKRETEGLNEAELIDYIDSMNLQPPKPTFEATPKPHVNSATYKARRNYFLFVREYRKQFNDPKTEGKRKFQVNSIALACLAMTEARLKPKLIEEEAVKVAAKEGYTSKTSGRDLQNTYNNLQSGVNLYQSRQNNWNKVFKQAAMILKAKPKALEALNNLKSKFKERHGF